jgi:hypothetical protein
MGSDPADEVVVLNGDCLRYLLPQGVSFILKQNLHGVCLEDITDRFRERCASRIRDDMPVIPILNFAKPSARGTQAMPFPLAKIASLTLAIVTGSFSIS